MDTLYDMGWLFAVRCYIASKYSWLGHQMETFSALQAICAWTSPVPGEFPAQRPVTRSFDVFFDLRLNKRLSKQSWGWWFETLSCPLWRHCNVVNYTPLSKQWYKSLHSNEVRLYDFLFSKTFPISKQCAATNLNSEWGINITWSNKSLARKRKRSRDPFTNRD